MEMSRAKSVYSELGFVSLIWKSGKYVKSRVKNHVARKEALNSTHTHKELCKSGLVSRPHYGYPAYHAGLLADRLGIETISLIEFGVAGGNGLVSLEEHANRIESEFDVEVEIYGFDSASGLPEPTDYRDLPYKWSEGDFEMDVESLRDRLTRSELVLGDVQDTTKSFVSEFDPAPIGFIAFDLDFYSSTMGALDIFSVPDDYTLPRVATFFDDTCWDMITSYNKYTGVRRAIRDFNDQNDSGKIAAIHFRQELDENYHIRPKRQYMYHRFGHPEYETTIQTRGGEDMGLEQ